MCLLTKLIRRSSTLTIMNSEGVKIVARSFAEAWKEVDTVTTIDNDQEGFMKITFIKVPNALELM